MSRPVIGISAYDQRASWGFWRDVRAVLLPHDYVRAVAGAGGAPVLVPPLPGVSAETVRGLDGLVLAGGADLDPTWYGAEPEPLTRSQPARDAAERELAEAALNAGLPVLGVCRGLQLLNVLRGGTLHQHVEGHNDAPGEWTDVGVRIDAGTRTAAAAGGEKLTVACHHHQAIDRLGAGLLVTARAEDGTIEAVEDPELPFVVAVQWHPEAGDDHGVFAALVEAAG